MSLYPILWAVDHAPVRDAEERALLVALVVKGDFDGCNCFRSYKTLAEKARVDPKTAGRRCREMEARGLLRRQEEHQSEVWLRIPEEQRPVIWEVMIPATWWGPEQLADINDQRAGLGRPALTPENRPKLAPAPPKKTRTDKGSTRPKDVDRTGDLGILDFEGTPGTTSPHPPDSQSPPPGLVVPQPSETPSESPSETEPAPSARSADDVRRTSSGSSARGGNCGCAASDQTGPVADEVGEAAGGGVPTPQEPGGVAEGVPGQRGAGGQQGTGGGKRARKSPFTWELRQRIYAVEALLPAPLREALALVLPHGHLPNANRKVTAQALESRSVEQLGERAARRWISYGYERDHHDGLLRSPLGVVEELLRPTPYCPDPECEDGTNVHTGQPCNPCTERIEQRRRARRAGRTVPTHRPPRLYQHPEQCEVCDRPFADEVPEDLVCTGCRAEMDRATAFVTVAPAPEPEPLPEDHPDAAYAPNGPSPEYRHRREELAAAKHNALTNPPPF